MYVYIPINRTLMYMYMYCRNTGVPVNEFASGLSTTRPLVRWAGFRRRPLFVFCAGRRTIRTESRTNAALSAHCPPATSGAANSGGEGKRPGPGHNLQRRVRALQLRAEATVPMRPPPAHILHRSDQCVPHSTPQLLLRRRRRSAAGGGQSGPGPDNAPVREHKHERSVRTAVLARVGPGAGDVRRVAVHWRWRCRHVPAAGEREQLQLQRRRQRPARVSSILRVPAADVLAALRTVRLGVRSRPATLTGHHNRNSSCSDRRRRLAGQLTSGTQSLTPALPSRD